MLAVVSMGTFMTPFDGSIVAVALPAMGDSLHLSYSYALWAQAAYLLVTSALLIPAGRIADSRSPIGYNLAGNLVFALGSALAGVAQNGLMLIVGRCVQGAGGAFMFATSVGIITAVFPHGQRGKAIGINLTAGYVGLMAGPVAGGLLVAHLGWRWVFFINLPVAAAVLAAGWTLVRAERREQHAAPGIEQRPRSRGSVDWPGPLLLAAFLTALFIPLTFSPLWGWGNARTVGLLLAAIVLLRRLHREGESRCSPDARPRPASQQSRVHDRLLGGLRLLSGNVRDDSLSPPSTPRWCRVVQPRRPG